jgi:uncharacterized protein (DUF305 family)
MPSAEPPTGAPAILVDGLCLGSKVSRRVAVTALVPSLLFGTFAPEALSARTEPPTGCATPISPQSANSGASPIAVIDDLAFLDGMIGLHVQAVALANKGLQLAQDSQVRRMALRVAEGQAGEIQLLKSWRYAWFPASGPLQIEAAELPRCDELSFDLWFLSQMQIQMRAQVTLASAAEELADHAELRDFARSTVEVRTSELRSIDTLMERVSPVATAGS